jgi:SAM-dependent methyltransferase
MHPSSMNNMKKIKEHLKINEKIKILDVGGRALTEGSDRSYQSIFAEVDSSYYIADIVDGVGVTHVMPGPYTLPFLDDTFDLIVSGQTLEHVKNPFRSVEEMVRVLKPGGYIALIAPSAGPRHDVIDCWRFMDDAFAAIAEETGLKTILDYVDLKAPDERSRKWADHVFLGRK